MSAFVVFGEYDLWVFGHINVSRRSHCSQCDTTVTSLHPTRPMIFDKLTKRYGFFACDALDAIA